LDLEIGGVISRWRSEGIIGRKLYQGIKADGAADDSPSQGKGKSNKTLLLEWGSRHSGEKVNGERVVVEKVFKCN
jgi:hypothetical protein